MSIEQSSVTCMRVCLSAKHMPISRNCMSEHHQMFLHIDCGRGSVIL